MDFIKQIACMISESTDAPSYDDIFTLCKIFGKEPDDDTMGPEEYAKLPEAEKAKIHDYIDQLNTQDATDQELETIEKYIGTFKDAKADDIEFDWEKEETYDDEGFIVDKNGRRVKDKKKEKKYLDGDNEEDVKKILTKVAHVFVAESILYFDPRKHKNPDFDPEDDESDEVEDYQDINWKKSQRKVGTFKFPTLEAANEWCEKRIDYRCKQMGLNRAEFVEGKDVVPTEMKDQDPNAKGYLYLKLFGPIDSIVGKRGRKAKHANPELDKIVKLKRKSYEVRLEYIVYTSPTIIKTTGKALNDLAVKITKSKDDSDT
jgi:hypothetical protein